MNCVIDGLRQSRVQEEPYPYFVKEDFFDPESFGALNMQFPTEEFFRPNLQGEYSGGRIDLCSGDPLFRRFLATAPAWNALFQAVNSTVFVDLLLDLFEPFIRPKGGMFSRTNARLVQHSHFRRLSLLSRIPNRLNRTLLRRTGLGSLKDAAIRVFRPNDLYVQFNIGRTRAGYEVEPHTDNRNKLIVLIIYFSNTDEFTDEGGDLQILRHMTKKKSEDCERYSGPNTVQEVLRIRPRRNLCVGMLNSNDAYHSTTPWKTNKEARRLLYIALVKRYVESAWRTSYFTLSDEMPPKR